MMSTHFYHNLVPGLMSRKSFLYVDFLGTNKLLKLAIPNGHIFVNKYLSSVGGMLISSPAGQFSGSELLSASFN